MTNTVSAGVGYGRGGVSDEQAVGCEIIRGLAMIIAALIGGWFFSVAMGKLQAGLEAVHFEQYTGPTVTRANVSNSGGGYVFELHSASEPSGYIDDTRAKGGGW